MNAAVRVDVFVDGQPYGSMRLRGRVTAEVAPGQHHVELRTSQGKTTAGSLTAKPGDTEFIVKMTALGTPKIS